MHNYDFWLLSSSESPCTIGGVSYVHYILGLCPRDEYFYMPAMFVYRFHV